MLSPNVERALRTAIERNPDLAPTLSALAQKLRDSVVEYDVGTEPLGADKNESRGPRRFKVVIERRGSRLVDVDNGAGGTKALLDALRYEGLIPNDDPGSIDYVFTQQKVKKADRGTQVTITPL